MSGYETDQETFADLPEVRELTKTQRRVLGVLVEKAFTVPESYPMTLKGATVGCNQKSNRSPVTSYSEDAVLQALDELRGMGLVAVIHTESGRTERYRHFTRKRFPFTEPQLAIVTELMLRGQQQMGELRARASRMVPIESLEQLREEVAGLIAQNYVQTDGPLDRRGVEIDHCFYQPQENAQAMTRSTSAPAGEASALSSARSSEPTAASMPVPATAANADRTADELAELRENHRDLRAEVEELRSQLEELKDSLTDLRQSLGA